MEVLTPFITNLKNIHSFFERQSFPICYLATLSRQAPIFFLKHALLKINPLLYNSFCIPLLVLTKFVLNKL